jgi:predicted ATP-dependent serine protease
MSVQCQACGFQVFNRWYPKCERCAEQDRQGADQAWLERQEAAKEETHKRRHNSSSDAGSAAVIEGGGSHS